MILCSLKLLTLRMMPLNYVKRLFFVNTRERIDVNWSCHKSPFSDYAATLYRVYTYS